AEALLAARADGMLTAQHWDALEAAARAARGGARAGALVPEADGCPECGERDPDRLVWGSAEGEDPATVRCASCGIVYEPPGPPRCPKCAAALTDHVHDPDGRRVCGACGHAWDEPDPGS
ncbi:MAG TPA: hypothetical protein VFF65_03425, partial [Phycisphaerales bacterium]|nr:hypothetical protein [Phycisphaerales bacterium]